MTVGNAILVYKSSMQPTVATSPAEAELRGVSSATKEIKWARYALAEYGYAQDYASELSCDCDPAIRIVKNTGSGSSMRHVDVDYRHAQEAVARNIVDVKGVDTADQQADILTKASIPAKQFHKLNNFFMQGVNASSDAIITKLVRFRTEDEDKGD